MVKFKESTIVVFWTRQRRIDEWVNRRSALGQGARSLCEERRDTLNITQVHFLLRVSGTWPVGCKQQGEKI